MCKHCQEIREQELGKSYEPGATEKVLYKYWEENGYFKAKRNPDKKPYTIIMPPPNITGQLHMGHALDVSLQDTLIRRKRMEGFEALLQPGCDHAAIATEAKIVAAMAEEGLSKEDLGREGFLRRAWEWKDKYRERIMTQFRRLGTSCDFSRERFTMDEGNSRAVQAVFEEYYKKGYIYRGERLINWCPGCKTSISDAEVNYEEQDSFLWEIAYPSEDGSFEIVVATTRPETMLGDQAVAVHPEDERYLSLVGRQLRLPLTNRLIPVIADDYVEREFGTGAVKITPAHDPNDYEMAQRHQLPTVDVFTEDGRIAEINSAYDGLPLREAREAMVRDLRSAGLLRAQKPFKHNVGVCYRCHANIEPRLSSQWFVSMPKLAEAALAAVQRGETRFIPERFKKIYDHWLENIKDWCISRQLWWGHRIPAYYCDGCGAVHVGTAAPSRCPHCGSAHFTQDEDTLDTWFSSALWPFTTLGWRENEEDFRYFYPSDVLVTGYDIIFFWVARMLFQAIELTGEVPFRDVFIHGIVRDALGRKMSKSLDNGIDPLDIIGEYGADVLRYSLISGTAPGNDQRYDETKLQAGRAHVTKLWNAFRFMLPYFDLKTSYRELPPEAFLCREDRWILSRVNRLADEIAKNYDAYDLGVALDKIWFFFRDEFCDWYLEMSKARLFDASAAQREEASATLQYVLSAFLRLLHPFMPFVSESLWQKCFAQRCAWPSIMLAEAPQCNPAFVCSEAEEEMESFFAAVRQLRNLRAEYGIAAKKKLTIDLYTDDVRSRALFEESRAHLERFCNVSEVKAHSFNEVRSENAQSLIFAKFEILIPMDDLIDLEAELNKQKAEAERLKKLCLAQENKLKNEAFVSRAPEKVVQAERAKWEDYRSMLQVAERRCEELQQSLRG